MRKIVHVIRKFDNIVVYSVPVELGGVTCEPSDQEYFDQAFRTAVAVNAVKLGDCDKVKFEFQ